MAQTNASNDVRNALKSIGFGEVKKCNKELTKSEAIDLIAKSISSWKCVKQEDVKVDNLS